ncbi:hypothetical protein M0P65_06555 [Candidatus Gracilibacteria bacterium]|jgi:hypothetical protein|nr:hypothetical protein [Candidatus Gracilibacteria bacterium]
MNQNTRIELMDTMIEAIKKISENNPGALTACMDLLKYGDQIDPDNLLGGFGNLLTLDAMGIYGTDIYVLWSDICDRNVAKMITILRAFQLGFISDEIVVNASHRQDYSGKYMINISELYNKVKETLPNFDPKNKSGFTFVQKLN